MNRSRLNLGIFALALLLLTPGLVLAQNNGAGNARNTGLTPMPVLIITAGADNAVNGGGTGGSLDGAFSTVIVYNNGLVLSFSNDDGTGTNTGTDCDVQAFSISQDRLNQLIRDLRRAGGMRAGSTANQGGNNEAGALITVTVLRDAGNSSNSIANTFSFFEASGSSQRVLNLLNTFFDELGIDQFGGDDDNGGTGS